MNKQFLRKNHSILEKSHRFASKFVSKWNEKKKNSKHLIEFIEAYIYLFISANGHNLYCISIIVRFWRQYVYQITCCAHLNWLPKWVDIMTSDTYISKALSHTVYVANLTCLIQIRIPIHGLIFLNIKLKTWKKKIKDCNWDRKCSHLRSD